MIEPLYRDEQATLYSARWEDVLAELPEVDAVITDPPYGPRTLAGLSTLRKVEGDALPKPGAEFDAWGAKEVHDFVRALAQKNCGWWFVMASHDQIPMYEHAYEDAGLYHFAPVPIIMLASGVRYTGDGPCSQAVYGMAARPRSLRYSKWASLPGYYTTTKRGSGSGRTKPYDLMLPIVCDYSREGDTILDPCSGLGMTGRAAKDGIRNAILVECEENLAHASIEVIKPRRAFQQPMLEVDMNP